MQIHYLEIVTREVDAVCDAYAAANGTPFGDPDARLGNARTARCRAAGWWGCGHPCRRQRSRWCGPTGWWTTLKQPSPPR